MAGKTRVIGLNKLKRKINALPRVTRDELKKALDKGGDDFVRVGRQLAPVDEGDTRDSFRHRVGEHELQRKLLSGDEKTPYIHILEWGSVKMEPQPSHVPAYRLVRKRIKGRVKRAIKKAAREVARGNR